MDSSENNPYTAPESRIAVQHQPRRTRHQCISDIAKGIGLLTLAGTPLAVALALLTLYVGELIQPQGGVQVNTMTLPSNWIVSGGLFASAFIPLSIIMGVLAGAWRPQLASKPVYVAGLSVMSALMPLALIAVAPSSMRLQALAAIAVMFSLPYSITVTGLAWLFVRKRRRTR